jgi:hypothetical protein
MGEKDLDFLKQLCATSRNKVKSWRDLTGQVAA